MYKKSTSAILLSVVVLSVFIVMYATKKETVFDTTYTSDFTLEVEYGDTMPTGDPQSQMLDVKYVVINGYHIDILNARHLEKDVWQLQTTDLGMIKLKTGSGETAGLPQVSLTSNQRGILLANIERATRPSEILRREIKQLSQEMYHKSNDIRAVERQIAAKQKENKRSNELIIEQLEDEISAIAEERQSIDMEVSTKKVQLRDALAQELQRKVSMKEVDDFIDGRKS
ncbi:MAG: hypothetical protein JXX29_03645 [Deltaproteobacteria bacterium]|nr:hypothetical protein [Deltaproteobacteria bacterium]MBN2670736.1 hypothetical protein [Deltaproteobacteria bacterium]